MIARLGQCRPPPSSNVVGADGAVLGNHPRERAKLGIKRHGAQPPARFPGAVSGSTRSGTIIRGLEPEGEPRGRVTEGVQSAAAARIRSEGLHVAATAVGVDAAHLLSASIGEPVPRSVLTLLACELLGEP